MEDIYSTPQSELTFASELDSPQEFYVVSMTKFTVLFFGTFGLYPIYWFFRNWRIQKEIHNESIMPVWRTIFRVFFVHSLFSRIEMAAFEKSNNDKWKSTPIATLYVIIMIVSAVADRLSYAEIGSPYTDFLFFPFMAIEFFILKKVQAVINVTCGDTQGLSNSQFSAANYIWLGLGFLFWVFILLGLFLIVEEGMAGEGIY